MICPICEKPCSSLINYKHVDIPCYFLAFFPRDILLTRMIIPLLTWFSTFQKIYIYSLLVKKKSNDWFPCGTAEEIQSKNSHWMKRKPSLLFSKEKRLQRNGFYERVLTPVLPWCSWQVQCMHVVNLKPFFWNSLYIRIHNSFSSYSENSHSK